MVVIIVQKSLFNKWHMFSNTDLLLEVDENKLNNAMRVLIKRSESTSHLANVKRYKKGIGKEKV